MLSTMHKAHCAHLCHQVLIVNYSRCSFPLEGTNKCQNLNTLTFVFNGSSGGGCSIVQYTSCSIMFGSVRIQYCVFNGGGCSIVQCCEYFGGSIVLTAAVTKCPLHLITIHFLSTCQQKDKDNEKDKDIY